jgi:hypothetical protein
MNTAEINRVMNSMQSTKYQYIGTFPSDKLPPPEQFPSCFIANMDSSSQPGSHWVAVYITKTGKAEYYDTYGRSPLPIFQNYLKTNFEVFKINKIQTQSFGTSVCGQHCIYFLYHRCLGRKMETIMLSLRKDTVDNDISICDWVNSNFNEDTPLIDLDMMQSASFFHQ